VEGILDGKGQVLLDQVLKLSSNSMLVTFESEVRGVDVAGFLEVEGFDVVDEAMSDKDALLVVFLFKLPDDS
jgi:hypothetical protein